MSRTIVSEIIPGTERSIPPCWTTRVWPIAAIASTAANGSMPSSAECRTLSGSKMRLRMNRAAVASQIGADAAVSRSENGAAEDAGGVAGGCDWLSAV